MQRRAKKVAARQLQATNAHGAAQELRARAREREGEDEYERERNENVRPVDPFLFDEINA